MQKLKSRINLVIWVSRTPDTEQKIKQSLPLDQSGVASIYIRM